MSGWPQERIERLKLLYAEGLSSSEIAARLGGMLSRNAVIGKVHRLIEAGRKECRVEHAAAVARPGSDAPGNWNSRAVNVAVTVYREDMGQKAKSASDVLSKEQRIRDLKARGYSRFAIQAATGASLKDIEATLGVKPLWVKP